MNNVRTYTGWGLALSAVLLSPIIVIFSIPLAIGIGIDIYKFAGETPIALALCAPGAYLLLRQIVPLAAARLAALLAAVAPAGHAAK